MDPNNFVCRVMNPPLKVPVMIGLPGLGIYPLAPVTVSRLGTRKAMRGQRTDRVRPDLLMWTLLQLAVCALQHLCFSWNTLIRSEDVPRKNQIKPVIAPMKINTCFFINSIAFGDI